MNDNLIFGYACSVWRTRKLLLFKKNAKHIFIAAEMGRQDMKFQNITKLTRRISNL